MIYRFDDADNDSYEAEIDFMRGLHNGDPAEGDEFEVRRIWQLHNGKRLMEIVRGWPRFDALEAHLREHCEDKIIEQWEDDHAAAMGEAAEAKGNPEK